MYNTCIISISIGRRKGEEKVSTWWPKISSHLSVSKKDTQGDGVVDFVKDEMVKAFIPLIDSVGKDKILNLLKAKKEIRKNDVKDLLGCPDIRAIDYLRVLEGEGEIARVEGVGPDPWYRRKE